MNPPYEKRKNQSSRSLLSLLMVGIICLVVGAFSALALRPPEKTFVYGGAHVNTTPTGSFYVVFASVDIPCGSPINRDNALVTMPENIVVSDGSRQVYPFLPVWQTEYVANPYDLLSSPEKSLVAERDIRRGERLSSEQLANLNYEAMPTCLISTPPPKATPGT